MSYETKKTFETAVWVDEKILAEGLAKKDQLVGSIDNGTSSTRFLVFTALGRIAASAQVEYTQYYPSGADKSGWHEHDPLEIWSSVVTCVNAVAKALKEKDIDLEKKPLAAVGITNQRETTIAWNSKTGVPYYNAIVWDDLRTTKIAEQVAKGNPDRLRDKTGLPLASYFAGTKVRWLLDNVPKLREDLQDHNEAKGVCFGTVDSWLVYQLTGLKSSAKGAVNFGGSFVTDVSNASRWLFLNLKTVQWDKQLVDALCRPHELPLSALPKVCPSSFNFGKGSKDCGMPALMGVPISGVLGDQQAALFGQCAFEPGKAKCTYGTGLFLMMNTGTVRVPSTSGLLTTIGYQIGSHGKVHYALEGSVSHSGSTIQWLRDKLEIIKTASDSEVLAAQTHSNEGLYFVPAFAGLFAPRWRSDARACLVGATISHHKGHVCRAALEAACYQAREVFEAMVADSPYVMKMLSVDGGATANRLMMQFQSDILNLPVVKPEVGETTSFGAALAAGLAVGVWNNLDEISELRAIRETYKPRMDEYHRERNWRDWNKAVSRSIGWIDSDDHLILDKKSKSFFETYKSANIVALVAVAAGVGYLIGSRKK